MKYFTICLLVFVLACNKSEYENLSQYCDDEVYSESPALHSIKYKLESEKSTTATSSGYGTGISTVGNISTVFIEMTWDNGNVAIEIAQALNGTADTFSVNEAYSILSLGSKPFQVANTNPSSGVNLMVYGGDASSRHESKYRINTDSHFTITERGAIYQQNGISFADVEGSFCCYVYDLQAQTTQRIVGNFSGKAKLGG